MKETSPPIPPFLIGFALLMLLPVPIAFFDVALGNTTAYETRLIIWNQPWVFVSGFAVFLTWMSARQAKESFWAIKGVDFAILAFLVGLSMVLSRTIAANTQMADLLLTRLGVAILLGVSAYYGMKTYGHLFSQIIYSTLIVAGLAITPFVLVFIYFQEESRALGSSIAWYIPGFGPVRLFGVFYEVAIVLCLGLIVAARSRSTMGLLGLALVILWTALFWSGGRGALLSLFLTVGLGSLFYRDKALKLWVVLLVSGIVGALISVPLYVPDGSAFGIINLLQSAGREDANAFSAGRLERWVETIELIKAQPVFGYGLSQFSNVWSVFEEFDALNARATPQSPFFLIYRNVHNIVLEAFFSWGIIGGGLFFVLLIKTWLTLAKRVWVAAPIEKLPAFLALNTLLFHANFTGIYIFPHSLIYLAIFFGICLAPNPAQNKNTSGGSP